MFNVKDFKVGDRILFDHFGGVNRPGRITKITAGAVHVEWTSPSSGKTRVVAIRTVPPRVTYAPSTYIEADEKNIRFAKEAS